VAHVTESHPDRGNSSLIYLGPGRSGVYRISPQHLLKEVIEPLGFNVLIVTPGVGFHVPIPLSLAVILGTLMMAILVSAIAGKTAVKVPENI